MVKAIISFKNVGQTQRGPGKKFRPPAHFDFLTPPQPISDFWTPIPSYSEISPPPPILKSKQYTSMSGQIMRLTYSQIHGDEQH